MNVTKMSVLMAALLASLVGFARADDSSMSRFGGDSYAYFNSQPVEKGPLEWRAENPQGISERQLQAYSGVGESWHIDKPTFTNIASDPTFRETHPNGLTERELQALSSESSAWQLRNAPAPSTVASGKQSDVAQIASNQKLADRVAAFFRPAK